MNELTSQAINKKLNDAFNHLNNGNTSQSEAVLAQLLDMPINDVGNLIRLGTLALNLGHTVHAINMYSKAADASPKNAIPLDLLGYAFIENNSPDQATLALQKAIEINPKLPDPYIRLGGLAISRNDFSGAIPLLRKAIELKPSEPAAYANITQALRVVREYDEAMKYARKLIELEPNNSENHVSLGRILVETGDIDAARKEFEKALKLDKTDGFALNNLVAITKFTDCNDKIIQSAEKALQTSMPSRHRSYIHFSLGKAFDDCQEWNKAYEHYRQGNMIEKPAIIHDAHYLRFKKITRTYNRKIMADAEETGSDSGIPVFVVGMPRSGTTLIEQIIASHPQAAGAGELTVIDRIDKAICPTESIKQYQKKFAENYSRDIFLEYAEDYLAVLRQSDSDATRIVDKMPDNFFHLGLIHTLFPRAHIIHAIRHPLDTCLSCYFQPFTFLPWTYDLEWIANRYKFYRKAMDHWKQVFPEGKITDVHYEDIIADSQQQTRRIIDSIDLPWDDACLSYYKRKREINTASVWQARQPIYTRSRNRWINYAPHIETLARGLIDYLSEEDIQEFERIGLKLKKKWHLGFG